MSTLPSTVIASVEVMQCPGGIALPYAVENLDAGARDRREARRRTCAEDAQGAGRVSVQVRSVGTSNRGVDGRASYRTLGWSHPVLTTHLTLAKYSRFGDTQQTAVVSSWRICSRSAQLRPS
jgi:hypothetical protein